MGCPAHIVYFCGIRIDSKKLLLMSELLHQQVEVWIEKL